jgi:hypothetical protein
MLLSFKAPLLDLHLWSMTVLRHTILTGHY